MYFYAPTCPLPLKGCHTILCETWTISSIALNVGRLLERYYLSLGKNKEEARCHVDMLPHCDDKMYNEFSQVAEAIMRIFKAGNDSKTLVLISAVISGKSIQNLEETFNEEKIQQKSNYSFDNLKYIALYKLKNDSKDYKDFFNNYCGREVFSVHKNNEIIREKQKHHSIYVDVKKMLEVPHFQKRFEDKLNSREIKDSVKLIITPDHDAGRAMLAFAKNVLSDDKIRSVMHPTQPNGDTSSLNDALGKMNSNDSILILDDVSITGNRLTQYHAELNELSYRGCIHMIVGVARPTEMSKWNKRKKNLSVGNQNKNRIECIEEVILTNLDERECPWCKEKLLLENFLDKNNSLDGCLKQLINTRLDSLRKSDGLTKQAFWYPINQPPFREGSIFFDKGEDVEYTSADVITAIAASIQHKRSEKELSVNFPNVKLINPDDYLSPGRRYFDESINLSIIRCAFNSELVSSQFKTEYERATWVSELLNKDKSHYLILEFIVAILQKKLPMLKNLPNTLESGSSIYQKLLARVIEYRLK